MAVVAGLMPVLMLAVLLALGRYEEKVLTGPARRRFPRTAMPSLTPATTRPRHRRDVDGDRLM
jgi:hypothetical protein